jgi:hypothetical protein
MTSWLTISGFLINIPLGAIVVAFLGAIKIPGGFGRRAINNRANIWSIVLGLDPVGFLLFTAFSIMFLLGLQGAERSTAIVLFLGAAVTFTVFGVWEYLAKENAMFPYSMLRERVVWSSCVVILLFQGCALVYSFFVPIYFQASKGAAPVWSGLYNSPGIGSQMIVAGVSSALGKSCPEREGGGGGLFRYRAYDYNSGEMGLLLAMEHNQRDLSLARIGFDVHTQPAFERTPVGGLPNHCRNRQRLRCNNGKPHQSRVPIGSPIMLTVYFSQWSPCRTYSPLNKFRWGCP